jgi:ATP-binding cassette subfamily B (MDR/TAP) protein 1
MEHLDDHSQNSKNYVLENLKAKSVGFFKLQYSYTRPKDIPILILATMASFGMGISMPLFAITFGDSINNFGDSQLISPEIFLEKIKNMCLQFVYIAIGMWGAGFLMIWLWSYNGRMIAKSIKEDYFKLLMQQEQGFFEVNPDILKYPTKIQSQIKKIEMGVKFYFKL